MTSSPTPFKDTGNLEPATAADAVSSDKAQEPGRVLERSILEGPILEGLSLGDDIPDRPDDLTFAHYMGLRRLRLAIKENGNLFAMFSVVFVNLIGFGLILPMIAFFAQSLNAAPWQVVLMFTAYSLGQFFAEPLCGRISDLVGRKPVLVATTGLSVLFYAALGFAPSIWVAIMIRFFSGLASGNVSTIQGYVSDVSRPDQRAARMSLIGAAFSLGFVMGPLLGFFAREEIGQMSGFRPPLYIAATLAAIATIGVILFVRETRNRPEPGPDKATSERLSLRGFGEAFRAALKLKVFVPIMLCTLCYMGALAGLESTFGLWAEARYHMGARDISIIFLFIGVAAALMQIVLTKPLVRRFGEARVLAAGLVVFGLSFVAQGLNAAPGLVIPFVVLGALGQAVIFANISAILSRAVGAEAQGTVMGLNMSVGAIARITGPIFAGVFFTHLGPNSPLWMGAAMTLPAAGLALMVGQVLKADEASHPAVHG